MIIRGLILCAILWAMPSLARDTARSAWDDVPTVDLTEVLEHTHELPHLGRPLGDLRISPHWLGVHGGPTALVADLDGDGHEEFLRSQADYFSICQVHPDRYPSVQDQVNFPREFGEGARNRGAALHRRELARPGHHLSAFASEGEMR